MKNILLFQFNYTPLLYLLQDLKQIETTKGYTYNALDTLML